MSHPIPMGLSGAKIEIHENVVVKHAKDIWRQGHHMTRLGTYVGPEIYMVHADSYSMERLETWRPRYKALGCENILEILVKDVWGMPAAIQISFDVNVFQDWLVDQDDDLHTMFCVAYPEGHPKEVLTHGDPTIANGMINDRACLRLIDGLPASAKIPSWQDVDEGKVLQSWFGWESVLLQVPEWRMYYSEPGQTKYIGPYLSKVLSNPRAWFWLAVHCKRILPYTNREDIHDWCEKIYKKALKLCSQSL